MTEQVQTQEAVTLEIADIANATQIMKAAIERGVFQAEEMSGVAGVFDKFNKFLAEVQAQAAGVDSEKNDEAPAEVDAE